MATTFEDAFKSYQESGRGQTVAGMHNAQTQANIASLKSTYDQNLSDAQAARGNIDTTYRANANNLGAQYERQRRNNNMQAAANGLNTGTASQMQLAQQNAYQRDYGNLMGQYGKDVAESERQMANLKAQYQNAVAQANAQGDYNRMAALMSDYNTQRNEQMRQAETLASYGIFTGYEGLGYSPESISSMRSLWIAQNPDLAYNTGAIDAERYRSMTGKYPAGYQAPSSGGGYYGGSKTKKSTKTSAETPTYTPPTIAKPTVTPQVFYRGSGWGPASGAIREVK